MDGERGWERERGDAGCGCEYLGYMSSMNSASTIVTTERALFFFIFFAAEQLQKHSKEERVRLN